jgi:hypothetical protein
MDDKATIIVGNAAEGVDPIECLRQKIEEALRRKCAISDRRWRIICDHYERSQRRKQERYGKKTGDQAPYDVPIPNRSLSDWDKSYRWFVVRNVDRVLMRIKNQSLERCEGWI